MSEEEKEDDDYWREQYLLNELKIKWQEYRMKYLNKCLPYDELLEWDNVISKFKVWFGCYADYNCVLPMHQLN